MVLIQRAMFNKPMIYLMMDCDEYLAAQRMAQLKSAMGDPEMADLNTTELVGSQTSVAELLSQANMMPFLAERRQLKVQGMLTHLDKRMSASKGTESAAHADAVRLLDGLPTLPDSCDMIFLEDKGIDKRRHLWRGFSWSSKDKQSGEKIERKIPGIQSLIKAQQIVQETLATPEPRTLPGWIQRRVKERQIEIKGPAIQMLANFIGADLRQLDNEMEKLSLYAKGRAITPADVKLLVSDASEALIWDLTDALSQRNGGKAMRTLYELRANDANQFYLLTMIARQYRIMIKVKDAMVRLGGRGNENEIAKMVGESPYPVRKAMQQTRNYTLERLSMIMERLLQVDFAMKTGANPETEIDILVAELTIN